MLNCVWTVGERSALWHLAFGIGKSGRAGKLHAHPPKSKVEGLGETAVATINSARIGSNRGGAHELCNSTAFCEGTHPRVDFARPPRA